jgi:hypothetical protein
VRCLALSFSDGSSPFKCTLILSCVCELRRYALCDRFRLLCAGGRLRLGHMEATSIGGMFGFA